MALRNWFGPSRREIWQQLSEELGATYIKGRAFKADKVQVSYGEWIVTLDTYAVSTGKVTMIFTRMRAPYVNPDKFRFRIYRKGVFSALGKFFGMQDIEVGYPEFDQEFIIQGSDDSRVQQLFANEKIRALVSGQKDIQFSVKDNEGVFGPKFPDDVDELNFVVLGVMKDVAALKQLYELFAETLDELCRMGAAYTSDPEIRV
ncbi:MAG: DUF3137 domain-containing protein [Vicinamibacterales bacterium]